MALLRVQTPQILTQNAPQTALLTTLQTTLPNLPLRADAMIGCMDLARAGSHYDWSKETSQELDESWEKAATAPKGPRARASKIMQTPLRGVHVL